MEMTDEALRPLLLAQHFDDDNMPADIAGFQYLSSGAYRHVFLAPTRDFVVKVPRALSLARKMQYDEVGLVWEGRELPRGWRYPKAGLTEVDSEPLVVMEYIDGPMAWQAYALDYDLDDFTGSETWEVLLQDLQDAADVLGLYDLNEYGVIMDENDYLVPVDLGH